MARASTGGITAKKTRLGVAFHARFRAYGQRRSVLLGYDVDGMTMKRAETELANILADVRRGTWQHPDDVAPAPEPQTAPLFIDFAEQWFTRQLAEGGRHGTGLSDAGAADLKWRLEVHLLPFFQDMRLDAIRVEDIDRYRLEKVQTHRRYRTLAEQPVPGEAKAAAAHRKRVQEARAGAIGPTSINKTIQTLAAILELAAEYDLIARNPAKGRRRRLPATKPRRTYLDRADHIAALLAGASVVDKTARANRGQRRAIVAMLVFGGLRIGELLALRWRDIDLARGTIQVRKGKTDAAERTVTIRPVLRDELASYRASLRPTACEPAALAFATSTGAAWSATNVRRRVLAKAVAEANDALVAAGEEPLPEKLTPHSLRRTFASLLFAVGEMPPRVMAEMGHTTAALTLAVYAKEMDRRDGEPERLKALVEGLDWETAGYEALSTTADQGSAAAA